MKEPVREETVGAGGGGGSALLLLLASYFNGTPLPPEVYALGPVAIGWAMSKTVRWWRTRNPVTLETVRRIIREEISRQQENQGEKFPR